MVSVEVTENQLAANCPISQEVITNICQKACSATIGTKGLDGTEATWNSQIIDSILAGLKEQSQNYKYLVTVTVAASRATGPIQVSTGAFWNSDKDGLWKYKWASDNVDAVITIAWIFTS